MESKEEGAYRKFHSKVMWGITYLMLTLLPVFVFTNASLGKELYD